MANHLKISAILLITFGLLSGQIQAKPGNWFYNTWSEYVSLNIWKAFGGTTRENCQSNLLRSDKENSVRGFIKNKNLSRQKLKVLNNLFDFIKYDYDTPQKRQNRKEDIVLLRKLSNLYIHNIGKVLGFYSLYENSDYKEARKIFGKSIPLYCLSEYEPIPKTMQQFDNDYKNERRKNIDHILDQRKQKLYVKFVNHITLRTAKNNAQMKVNKLNLSLSYIKNKNIRNTLKSVKNDLAKLKFLLRKDLADYPLLTTNIFKELSHNKIYKNYQENNNIFNDEAYKLFSKTHIEAIKELKVELIGNSGNTGMGYLCKKIDRIPHRTFEDYSLIRLLLANQEHQDLLEKEIKKDYRKKGYLYGALCRVVVDHHVQAGEQIITRSIITVGSMLLTVGLSALNYTKLMITALLAEGVYIGSDLLIDTIKQCSAKAPPVGKLLRSSYAASDCITSAVLTSLQFAIAYYGGRAIIKSKKIDFGPKRPMADSSDELLNIAKKDAKNMDKLIKSRYGLIENTDIQLSKLNSRHLYFDPTKGNQKIINLNGEIQTKLKNNIERLNRWNKNQISSRYMHDKQETLADIIIILKDSQKTNTPGLWKSSVDDLKGIISRIRGHQERLEVLIREATVARVNVEFGKKYAHLTKQSFPRNIKVVSIDTNGEIILAEIKMNYNQFKNEFSKYRKLSASYTSNNPVDDKLRLSRMFEEMDGHADDIRRAEYTFQEMKFAKQSRGNAFKHPEQDEIFNGMEDVLNFSKNPKNAPRSDAYKHILKKERGDERKYFAKSLFKLNFITKRFYGKSKYMTLLKDSAKEVSQVGNLSVYFKIGLATSAFGTAATLPSLWDLGYIGKWYHNADNFINYWIRAGSRQVGARPATDEEIACATQEREWSFFNACWYKLVRDYMGSEYIDMRMDPGKKLHLNPYAMRKLIEYAQFMLALRANEGQGYFFKIAEKALKDAHHAAFKQKMMGYLKDIFPDKKIMLLAISDILHEEDENIRKQKVTQFKINYSKQLKAIDHFTYVVITTHGELKNEIYNSIQNTYDVPDETFVGLEEIAKETFMSIERDIINKKKIPLPSNGNY